MKSAVIVLSIAILCSWGARAQVLIDLSGSGVKAQVGKASVAENTAGSMAPDVQMDGVAIINGEIYIDGERVPKGKPTFTSKKSGKAYLIKWGKDGSVAAQEK